MASQAVVPIPPSGAIRARIAGRMAPALLEFAVLSVVTETKDDSKSGFHYITEAQWPRSSNFATHHL